MPRCYVTQRPRTPYRNIFADGQHQTRRRLSRPQKLPKMSMFRAKKLDLGCFVNIKVIRDHTKRKVYEKHETER